METTPLNNPAKEAEQAQDIISRAKANSKRIVCLTVFIFVVIAAILIWFFISQNNARKADEAVGRADAEQNDSVALVLYKEAATMGHRSGNRAKLEVAMRLYATGDYQGALEYLDDAKIDDNIVAAGAYTLKGDCYVNLKQYPAALEAYDDAIDAADKNPAVVPLILFKKANIYRAEKNYEDEYDCLKEIIDDYPEYDANTQVDVRKYYERAKAAAGK